MAKLKVVQGDIFPVFFNPGSIDIKKIQKVYFSSRYLGITKELTLIDKIYIAEISPEETAKFKVGRGTYDITVYFTDDKPVTTNYCVDIEVLEKTNKVTLR